MLHLEGGQAGWQGKAATLEHALYVAGNWFGMVDTRLGAHCKISQAGEGLAGVVCHEFIGSLGGHGSAVLTGSRKTDCPLAGNCHSSAKMPFKGRILSYPPCNQVIKLNLHPRYIDPYITDSDTFSFHAEPSFPPVEVFITI
jgi:hypothetical protein